MHWLWYLVGGYLLCCAAGWTAVFWHCPDQAADFNEWFRRALKARPVRALLGSLLAALVMGPLFPLLYAYGAWKCWRENREDERFRRTYRPVEFLPLNRADLPEEARDHLDQCTPLIERLGFGSVVTWQLKPPPKPVLARCLLSSDRATVADIAWIFGSPALSFLSVLDGGHVLDTACMECLPPDDIAQINDSGRFTVQWHELGQGWSFTCCWRSIRAIKRGWPNWSGNSTAAPCCGAPIRFLP
jgi:hypothetical protein